GVERHAARRSVRAHSRYDAGRRTRLAEAGGGRRRDRVHAEQGRLPRRADGAAERRGGAQATEVRGAGSGEVIHYRGNISGMAIAHSKLTAQGQISVPAEVRRKLGIGPGSVLEWDDDGEQVVVRRVGRYTSEDVHRSLFATPLRPRTLAELKAGVGRHIRRRRASR